MEVISRAMGRRLGTGDINGINIRTENMHKEHEHAYCRWVSK